MSSKVGVRERKEEFQKGGGKRKEVKISQYRTRGKRKKKFIKKR